ncbi:heat shock transcription factor, Y-linked-like [Centruroides vittatus]|uniref:heat shock transcription factor, Y-linked-like n=1 Tax=Centruroides vittatus TaxID=120091 RepID=UPI00350ED77E
MKKRTRRRTIMYSLTYSKKYSEGQSLLSMRFPQKLWKIVNECQTGAISWSHQGDSIILDYPKFQEEYLESNVDIFKTSNITSFIRQLNLYGFRKVNHYNRESSKRMGQQDFHEFRNEWFLRGRHDLLSKVSRKPSNIKPRLGYKKRSGNTSRIAKCQMALQAALHRQHIILQNKYGRPSTRISASKSIETHKKSSTHYLWNVRGNNRNGIQRRPPEVPQTKEESGVSVNWEEEKVIDILSQEEIKSSGSSMGSVMDVNHLLDPNISPWVYHSCESELTNLEESFALESVFSHMDKTLSEKIYHFLMTEEENKQCPPNNIDSFKTKRSSPSRAPLAVIDQNTCYASIPNAIHSCSHHFPNVTNWETMPTRSENTVEQYILNPVMDAPLYDFEIYDNHTYLQLFPIE